MQKITDVRTAEDLRKFMTEPSDGLVGMMKGLDGDIMVLGGTGKMGPELVEMLVRANKEAGAKVRSISAAGLFVSPRDEATREILEGELGVKCYSGDITDESYLGGLPDAPNVVYMIGFKFGTAADPGKAILMNCVVPSLVAMKYTSSKIVVFSSGNPYPHTPPADGGSKEGGTLEPQGIYGHSIVGRETAFNTCAHGHKEQKLCHYRLMYAQHLCYGVLVDLARMVRDGEPISLEMPYVNLISQRDAIDRALRGLEIASNPAAILNVSGAITSVREICTKLGEHMGKEPKFADEEADTALIANDDFCTSQFGPYRDEVDDMIEAAAGWVKAGGEDWNLPTMFGKATHEY